MSDIHFIIQEQFVYLYMALSRYENESHIKNIYNTALFLLSLIKRSINERSSSHQIYIQYLVYFFQLVLQTRDIDNGKGERHLCYMLLYAGYQRYPVVAMYAFNVLVGIHVMDTIVMNIGCWRDAFGLCDYIQKVSPEKENHPWIHEILTTVIKQLHKDYLNAGSHYKKLSLLSKWIPREHSAMGWIFQRLSIAWTTLLYPYRLNSVITDKQRERAYSKCARTFRIELSNMTRKLHVLETRICNHTRSSICPSKINIQSLHKYKLSLLNIDSNGNTREHAPEEHFIFSEKMVKHLDKDTMYLRKKWGYYENPATHIIKRTTTNGFNKISMNYFVKKAFELLSAPIVKELKSLNLELHNPKIEMEIDILNTEWREMVKNSKPLECFIPVLDISGYDWINRNMLYAAIGYACMICEKSTISKRILTIVRGEPRWINLDNANDFVSMISIIQTEIELDTLGVVQVVCNTNRRSHLLRAIDVLIESIQETNMTVENIEKMVLVILYNKAKSYGNVHYDIRKKFHVTNKVPYIVYWNISGEDTTPLTVLPCDIHCSRASIVTGLTLPLLNHFVFMSYEGVRQTNPYDCICNILMHERYSIMEKVIHKLLTEK